MEFVTEDAGPYAKFTPLPPAPEPLPDPVTELETRVRGLLRESAQEGLDAEALQQFAVATAKVAEDWRLLQKRVQNVFMLLAILRRQLQP